MQRYSVIEEKNKREIVLLRGSGCKWRRCTFCDYHSDCCADREANERLNADVLSKVTGKYQTLEVINSGSFPELPDKTMDTILQTCRNKRIHTLHFECHYLYKDKIAPLKERFAKEGVTVKIKSGVETFDAAFRENYLQKGIPDVSPETLASYFDEVCLLFGLSGQTAASMQRDLDIGLAYFERVCVNIMVENTTPVLPDQAVIDTFLSTVYPVYRDDSRVDILLHNSDFGVGGKEE